MVLWEANDEAADVSVGELGKRLHLDSGTLTPLLKKMEASGIVSRARSISDERVVLVSITDKGMELRDKCKDIPTHIGRCLNLNDKDFNELYKLLYKALDNMNS
jgi:DNA-binding MarR family transcriptional regulator